MIEWYDGFSTFIDLDEHVNQARRLRKKGDLNAAIWELIKGMHNVHADEGSWRRAATDLYESFVRSDLLREAVTVAWYLEEPQFMNALLPRLDRADHAAATAGARRLRRHLVSGNARDVLRSTG